MARAAGSNSPWPWRPDQTGPSLQPRHGPGAQFEPGRRIEPSRLPQASPWRRRTSPPPKPLRCPAFTLRNYCCRTPCGRRAIAAVGVAVVAVASAGSVPPVPTAAGTGEGLGASPTGSTTTAGGDGLRWRCRQSRNSREPRSRLGVGDSHGIGGGIIGADADAVVRGGRHERRSTTGMTRREPAGAGEAKRRRILFFLLGSESSAEEGLTGQRQPC